MINLADIRNSKDPKVRFDNRYRLIDKIGGGGFSEVWLAHDMNAGIDVALKIYTPNGELDDEGKDDFRREFARLCGLNHSNIIHAIGFGIHNDELPYLAMSVCKNGSAKKLIGNYEEEQLWTFIEQVTSGLQYLHTHDITHQDIKPDNILINSDGQYLIIDFGISTKTRNTLRKTDKGTVGGGTPWYMSCESYKPESSDIHARDIWALGASLYEIITGDVPFGQYGGLTQQAQKGKIPPITANISEELKQLIYDCLALEAWDRPDANAILERIKNHKEGNKKSGGNKKSILGIASAMILALVCYISYPYLNSSLFQSDTTNTVVINVNDSIFLSKVHEAIIITEAEINKKDLSTVDEKALCSAAEIFVEAQKLDVSESTILYGSKIWAASQNIIDNTYEYLYNKSVEYQEMGAEDACARFNRRSSQLVNYVTPEKVKKSLPIKGRSPEKSKENSEDLNPSNDITLPPSEGQPTISRE